MQTAPRAITQTVLQFCAQIASDQHPFYVDIKPDPKALPLECFPNVAAKIAQEAGTVEHGWAIWEWPGVFLEAEFHAVWGSPDGKLIDVTPTPDGEKRILYLPDPKRKYEGTSLPNRFLALSSDPRIHQVIRLREQQFELMNRGDRAHKTGLVNLEGREADEYEAIQLRLAFLIRELQIRNVGRNDPCPCGSGRKYKKCCGGS